MRAIGILQKTQALFRFGSLSLGLWTVLVFYNFTEAAFGGGLVLARCSFWSAIVPTRAKNLPDDVPWDQNRPGDWPNALPLETMVLQR